MTRCSMSIACPSCTAQNPDDKKYCGDCGAPLHSQSPSFRDQIQVVIKDQLKDQKVLEIETAQAIVARLLDWGKLFSIAVVIPLTILGAALGWFGVKTYSGFYTDVDKAKTDVIAEMHRDAQAKV